MKAITIATTRGDQASTLAALQDVGVVHLAEAPRHTAPDAVGVTRGRLDHVRHAAEVLAGAERSAAASRSRGPGRRAPSAAAATNSGSSDRGPGAAEPAGATARSVAPAGADGGAGTPRSAEAVVAEVERLAARLDDLRRTHAELSEERERLAPFGAFDPAAVRRLADQGVGVRLVQAPVRRPLPEVDGSTWVELSHDRHVRTLALVGPSAAVAAADLEDDVALPDEPPMRLAPQLEGIERAMERTRARLAAMAGARHAVERLARRVEDELHFEEARAAMSTVGAVALVRGFVPQGEVERVRALARERGWAIWITDVEDSAEAPTLIENPRWVRPIAPLFSFLGIVPAYGQVDISAAFLIFFSLFFAMIVGDAGYGAIFLLLTMWARRRYPAAPRRVFSLLRVLSLATIAWGVATGNYFGLVSLPAPLQGLRLDWLIEEHNVIALSFAVGALHLTLAHTWNALRFRNSVRALAEVGWVMTTWTMYLLARQLVLGVPVPPLTWWAFAVGVVLIVAFTTPWRLLRRDWFQHAMLPLTLVNNFVDVVSYVRLFAVGAATFAVAAAFNDLAAGIGLDGPLRALATALVLFLGHTLNVLLAAMGVLVHGVRLNTLEFAGHLGLAWTGHPYRPFARSAPRGGEGEPSWTPR